jgi:hypothetical protein
MSAHELNSYLAACRVFYAQCFFNFPTFILESYVRNLKFVVCLFSI